MLKIKTGKLMPLQPNQVSDFTMCSFFKSRLVRLLLLHSNVSIGVLLILRLAKVVKFDYKMSHLNLGLLTRYYLH